MRQDDDLDLDDDEPDLPPQPAGALRLVYAKGDGDSDNAAEAITAELWSGSEWLSLVSPEQARKGIIATGKWAHFCLVASEAKPAGVTLYVNGEKQLTAPCRPTLPAPIAPAPVAASSCGHGCVAGSSS